MKKEILEDINRKESKEEITIYFDKSIYRLNLAVASCVGLFLFIMLNASKSKIIAGIALFFLLAILIFTLLGMIYGIKSFIDKEPVFYRRLLVLILNAIIFTIFSSVMINNLLSTLRWIFE